MLIKIEIFLWLLLTLVLLLTPFVYFFKNYNTLTQSRHTRWNLWQEKRERSRLAREAKKTELIEEIATQNSETEHKITQEVWPEEVEASVEIVNDNDQQDIVKDDVVIEEQGVVPSFESVVVKEEDPIPPKIQKKLEQQHPSPTQEQRLKDQKKIEEIRMSVLSFKERWKTEDYEKKLIEWLALDPKNKEFNEWLSDYYFENKQYVKALSLLKKIVNTAPENHKAIRQIWQIYIQQDDLDTAKILIEKAISVRDDNPKYYITLVDIHYAKGDIPGAIKALEKVLKLRPKNIKYLMSIATLHEEAAEPRKAFQYYGKIIELDPMNDIAKKWIQRLS